MKILPLDGHFAKNFILLQVAVPIIHIYRKVTKPTRHLKLELLTKKWAGNKSNLLKTKHH
jgi:DNA-binding transcriptional regulator PaaX